MSYTVSCELPDLCDPGDWQDREPTPVDAVEAFVHALASYESYVFTVTDEKTQQTYRVDMAADPSVQPTSTTTPQGEV